MTAPASSVETLLAHLIKDFEQENKRKLAREMISQFGLDESGDEFSIQIRKILNRDLSDKEIFVIDALERIWRLRLVSAIDY